MRLARIENPSIPSRYGTGSNFSGNVSSILSTAIGFIFAAGVISFVFMFLIGALQWITSGGDKDALSRAKSRITHALIGLIVLLSVYAALSLLEGFLGVDLINIKLPGAI